VPTKGCFVYVISTGGGFLERELELEGMARRQAWKLRADLCSGSLQLLG
jgi:hypothetical protein